jgi:hypothetical protein
MNASDCIRAIAVSAKAGNTLCIAGPSGIGKTSITEQYADVQRAQGDFAYMVFNGATANLADTIGFLLPHEVTYEDAQGGKHVVPHGQYTYPHYYVDRATKRPAFMFERGLLVIEEYGQAAPDVKRALATLVQEHRVGEHELPKGFQIVLLTNRAQDRSGVGKDFDFVINRRVDIEFTPELDAWLVWASENDVNPLVMAFAARNPEIVFKGVHPEKQGPWCTPRSLVAAGRTIAAAEGMDVDFEDEKSFLMQMLMGSLGNSAIQLMVFLKLRHSLPKLEDIVAKPDTAMVPDKPDAQMIISHELAHRAERGNIAAVVKYMERLPKAFSVTFVQVLLKRAPALVGTKAVGDWSRDNHQLLAAISRG